MIDALNILFVDTHALVQFDEENASSIVPLQQMEKNRELWSDRKKYGGTLICLGDVPAAC